MSAPRYARRPRDVQQDRGRAVQELMRRFGVLAWFGSSTGMWWALVGSRLVEAEDPDALGTQIVSARWRGCR